MGELEERKTQKTGDSSKNNKSSAQKCSLKKVFYEKFIKTTGKYLCWSLFLTKFQDFSDKVIFLSILQKL